MDRASEEIGRHFYLCARRAEALTGTESPRPIVRVDLPRVGLTLQNIVGVWVIKPLPLFVGLSHPSAKVPKEVIRATR